jgi:hypothetical protein
MGRKLNGCRSGTGCACGALARDGSGHVREVPVSGRTGGAASRRLKGAGSGDRDDDPADGAVPPMLRGSARPTTDSLQTCLTVRRFRWVAG